MPACSDSTSGKRKQIFVGRPIAARVGEGVPNAVSCRSGKGMRLLAVVRGDKCGRDLRPREVFDQPVPQRGPKGARHHDDACLEGEDQFRLLLFAGPQDLP